MHDELEEQGWKAHDKAHSMLHDQVNLALL